MRPHSTTMGIRQRLSGLNLRRSVLVIAISGVLIADVLTGGAMRRRIASLKRYGQAAGIAVVALGLLLLVNRPGAANGTLLQTASTVVSSMPGNTTSNFMGQGLAYMAGRQGEPGASAAGGMLPSVMSGNTRVKRSVSGARKTAVAASQGWRCGQCQETLQASYEVDHVVELQDGGTNDVSNLSALCRNCHGQKTLERRLGRSG